MTRARKARHIIFHKQITRSKRIAFGVFVVFAALVLAPLFLATPAHAANFLVLEDQGSCEFLYSGTWDQASWTCTINSEQTVSSDDNLTVVNGVTLVVNDVFRVEGKLLNFGHIVINPNSELANRNEFENYGKIDVFGRLDNWRVEGGLTATLENFQEGTIVVHDGGDLSNDSFIFQGFSDIRNFGRIEIKAGGQLDNRFGQVYNNGLILNSGFVDDKSGLIKNEAGAIIRNELFALIDIQLTDATNEDTRGRIDNYGRIENFGEIDNSVETFVGDSLSGGTISNKAGALIINRGFIDNEGSLTENFGVIDNFGTLATSDDETSGPLGGSVHIEGKFLNAGTMYNDGALSIQDGEFDNSGTLLKDCNSTIDGTISNTGGSEYAICGAPVVPNVSITTAEDTPVSMPQVISDFLGNPISYTVPETPPTLSGFADGVPQPDATYHPPANFVGTDDIPALAQFHNTARHMTFSITMTPVNDPPVAIDQSVSTVMGQTVLISLVATFEVGDTQNYFVLSQPTHGTLPFISNNIVVYEPEDGFSGTDSFTFKANDGEFDSNTATVTIEVLDNAPPIVTGTLDRATPVSGWYRDTLTITWTGVDPSGIASCDEPTVYSGPDGASVTVVGHCTDNAGNVGEGAVTFNYDATAPTITGTLNVATPVSGWYRTDVTALFTASDATSGIKAFSSAIELDSEGAGQSATGFAEDNAGNIATFTIDGINIDKTPPEITVTRTQANENGWNNGDVTVHFQATDATSGIQGDSFFDVFFTLEGEGQSTGLVTFADMAGNIASEEVSDINIDKTPPEVTGAPATAPNENGWYNQDVTIEFSATDALSGIDGADTATEVISEEGNSQSASHTFTDLAGNSATGTVEGIMLDKTAPELTVPDDIVDVFPTSPDGAAVDFQAQAADNLDSSPVIEYSVEPGSTFPIGTTTVQVSATDHAGNSVTGSFTVTVLAPEEAAEELAEIVEEMELPQDIEDGLTDKLEAAANSIENGRDRPAQNQLGAFINQVNAQTGKSITEEQAEMLIEAARNIINSIS